jgi:hypothetical protein
MYMYCIVYIHGSVQLVSHLKAGTHGDLHELGFAGQCCWQEIAIASSLAPAPAGIAETPHTHNEFMTEHEPGALIKSPHMSKPWRCLRQFSGMIESSVLDVRRQNGWLAEQLAWSSQQAQTQAPIAKQGKGFLPFLGPTLATDTGW